MNGNEIRDAITARLAEMQPGERVSFGPYTFGEVLDGYVPPSPLAIGLARIADAIAADCRMEHLPGEPETATSSAYRMQRAEFEADVARLRQGKAQGG